MALSPISSVLKCYPCYESWFKFSCRRKRDYSLFIGEYLNTSTVENMDIDMDMSEYLHCISAVCTLCNIWDLFRVTASMLHHALQWLAHLTLQLPASRPRPRPPPPAGRVDTRTPHRQHAQMCSGSKSCLLLHESHSYYTFVHGFIDIGTKACQNYTFWFSICYLYLMKPLDHQDVHIWYIQFETKAI